jgi:hypothetical protein
MKTRIILILLLLSNIAFSQGLFESQCWKNTLKDLDTVTAIIAIVNDYDNFNTKNEGRYVIVIYFQNSEDSINEWQYKLILVDERNMIWQETTSRVNYFFCDYLSDSLESIRKDIRELYDDPRREWAYDLGSIALYYRDSKEEILNDYYSGIDVNGLVLKYPIIFNMYSYALNRSFNIKFYKKLKYR